MPLVDLRIAVTADLHWGHGSPGDEATMLLVEQLRADPPELLLLGGDLGTGDHFATLLQLFHDLPCKKALVPGNHDLWVNEDDARGDSLTVYEEYLPARAAEAGFHYLDHGPLVLPDADLAIVGCVNWYDYSWSLERMKAEVPNWQWHLQHKAFTRGRHNDRRFVRWPSDDMSFTRHVVGRFREQLDASLRQVGHALVLTHHPAFQGISFPRTNPAEGLDQLLWDALTGNTEIETLLTERADKLAAIFSGHTHRATQAMLGPAPGHNIGGDYHYKRMLILDWPSGTIHTHQFGDPNRPRRGK